DVVHAYDRKARYLCHRDCAICCVLRDKGCGICAGIHENRDWRFAFDLYLVLGHDVLQWFSSGELDDSLRADAGHVRPKQDGNDALGVSRGESAAEGIDHLRAKLINRYLHDETLPSWFARDVQKMLERRILAIRPPMQPIRQGIAGDRNEGYSRPRDLAVR